MPVSIITSQARPGAISFQRATCSSGVEDRAEPELSAASTSSAPTPCRTTRLASPESSERFGLGPDGHEEVAAAGIVKRSQRLARAEAIAVGLDRRACWHSRTILPASASWTERGAVDGQA